jgi:hypothetical protein
MYDRTQGGPADSYLDPYDYPDEIGQLFCKHPFCHAEVTPRSVYDLMHDDTVAEQVAKILTIAKNKYRMC